MAAALEEGSLRKGLLLIELESTGYCNLGKEVKRVSRDDDIIPVHGQVCTSPDFDTQLLAARVSDAVEDKGF
jgi:hypothetical protein